MPSYDPISLEMVFNELRVTDDVSSAVQGRRDFVRFYSAMIAALSTANAEYVLTGAMAYGLYAPTRATRDIDLLALDSSRVTIRESLSKGGFELVADLGDQISFSYPALSARLIIPAYSLHARAMERTMRRIDAM